MIHHRDLPIIVQGEYHCVTEGGGGLGLETGEGEGGRKGREREERKEGGRKERGEGGRREERGRRGREDGRCLIHGGDIKVPSSTCI